jgi:hypothetical protein
MPRVAHFARERHSAFLATLRWTGIREFGEEVERAAFEKGIHEGADEFIGIESDVGRTRSGFWKGL